MRSFVYYMGPIPANNNRQPSCSFADSLLAAHSLFFLMQEVRTSVLADSGSDPIWDCEGLCREKCV